MQKSSHRKSIFDDSEEPALPKHMVNDHNIDEISQLLEKHEYKFLEVLGSGSFAKCYKVLSTKYNQIFAAKTMKITHQNQNVLSQTTGNSKLPISVVAEIDSLVNIIHPNVIHIFEFFLEENDYFFIILEYCTGGSIADLVKKNGPLHHHQLYDISKQILRALKEIHSLKIAHKDIKPANILIDCHGRPKLADFGLAQHSGSENLDNRTGGSLPFMAPEYFSVNVRKSGGEQARHIDPFQADIWSLGITFYYMATGTLPYLWKTRDELKKMIARGAIMYPNTFSTHYKELLCGMLSPFPDKRKSIDELLEMPIFKSKSMNSNIPLSLMPLKTTNSMNQFTRYQAPVLPALINSQQSSSKPMTLSGMKGKKGKMPTDGLNSSSVNLLGGSQLNGFIYSKKRMILNTSNDTFPSTVSSTD